MKNVEDLSEQGKWANYFLNQGFKVIPIYGVKDDSSCCCGNAACNSIGKHPMVSGWRDAKFIFGSNEILEHWKKYPNSNYAILTDNLAVIDVDGPGGEKHFKKNLEPFLKDIPTLKVRTGRGSHRFYRVSQPIKSCVGILPKIDVRATGGFVVGAGSRHSSLAFYEVESFGSAQGQASSLANLPEGARDFLEKRSLGVGSGLSKKNELRACIAFGGKIQEGSRNDSLAMYLGGLVHKGLSEDQLRVLAIDFNLSHFVPPLDDDEVLAVVRSMARYSEKKESGPLPLFREVGVAQKYPISEMGEILYPVAQELLEQVQAPDAIIGQSLLVAASLAVQGHADIEIDGRIYPTSIFCITVGASGERKSSVDQKILSPFREYEQQAIDELKNIFKSYENSLSVYTAEKAKIINSKMSPSDKQKAIDNLGDEPQKPPGRIMLIEDPTYEGLVKLLESGRPSVGLFSDEAGRMIGGHSMNKENLVKTIAGLSGLWDGSSISRIRAGDGATKLYGRRLALHLMAQPKVAQLLFENEIVSDQGFLSRCLLAYPNSKIGTRLYQYNKGFTTNALDGFVLRIKDILSHPLPTEENGSLKPRKIKLDACARVAWVEFYNAIESESAEGCRYENIQGFASKAAEQALRIAGVLTLIKDLNAKTIGYDEVASAISMVKFYLSEALRLHGVSVLDPDLVLAQKLLDWCMSFSEVYVPQIYQSGPKPIREKKTAYRIISILESHGWLQKVEGGKEIAGSMRKNVWKVVKAPAISANNASENGKNSENSR